MAGAPKDFSGGREEKEEKHDQEKKRVGEDFSHRLYRADVPGFHLFLHNQVGASVWERSITRLSSLVSVWMLTANNKISRVNTSIGRVKCYFTSPVNGYDINAAYGMPEKPNRRCSRLHVIRDSTFRPNGTLLPAVCFREHSDARHDIPGTEGR